MCSTGSGFGSCRSPQSFMNASTSFFVTRPMRPVPVTLLRSMLCSAAMRRTTGVTGGSAPCGVAFCSSTCGSPGFAPASSRARTVPTSTVAPTSTRISVTRPLSGEGTSVSTLSVEISTITSSRSTQSPTRLCHSTIVPSATDTPI